ncbi:Replicative DNA helicase [Rubellimicrobium mesophilum DSM 19309]|uniref:Replicative DNA helicase n=1 Tax=Rubellimicrobium mesophilum DSM 19309 TaxID=442562 RepID=A0A017HB50_9RHOB|nr:AAA family ATPase [Rubellimicrobium mesophilum]EYD71581.1 Replicative DNA helicase [Rubellimicrobium mesophilum DSM 19309]
MRVANSAERPTFDAAESLRRYTEQAAAEARAEWLKQNPDKAAHAARQSRFYSAAELEGKAVPEQPWLVRDLVPDREVTLFSGDGGTGKSLLAQQLGIGVATNSGWLGMPVKAGRVIFISAEDDEDELHRRTDRILRATGRSYDDLAGLTLRSLAGEDALLAVESGLALIHTELFKELERRATKDTPALIVIDTLADVYPSNENDRTKVRQFIGILRGLAKRRQCAVMLLAHPSLTGLTSGSGTSGSTAWNNSVRSRLYLSRVADDGYEPDPDKRVLSTKKANYSQVGGEIALTWKAGVFTSDATPKDLDKRAASAKAERVFLSLLDEFTAQGRRVNHAGASTYAPSQFAKHPKREGISKSGFATAMNNLLSAGTITVGEEGPPSRRTKFLKRAGQ